MLDFATGLPLGWVEPQNRTNEQNDAHDKVMAAMPKFAMPSIAGGKPPVGTKMLLTDVWKHDRVIEAFGKPFAGWHQFTGSCVGVGGGNAMMTCSLLDILRRNDTEKIIVPFWAFNYGRSRQLGGMNGRGEGSMGSTFAQSANQDGTNDANISALKCPNIGEYHDASKQWTYTQADEMTWSDGRHADEALRVEAKPHKFTTTPLNSGEAVRDAIMNGYVVTRAFSRFVNPGTPKIRNGDVCVGSYNGSGGHQESWQGYWNHPVLGELVLEINQWGSVYTLDPAGTPGGIGCWLSIDEVDQQCRHNDAEIFAWSAYDGYPGQPDLYDWMKNSFFV